MTKRACHDRSKRVRRRAVLFCFAIKDLLEQYNRSLQILSEHRYSIGLRRCLQGRKDKIESSAEINLAWPCLLHTQRER